MTLTHTHTRSTPPTLVETQVLSIAYTPDSDDAFNYYAWEFGRVSLQTAGYHPQFVRNHIIALNRAAQEEQYDIVAVSSVAYPQLADRYWVLSVGNSVGRGYGPVLVSKYDLTIDQLQGKRIAVAGIPTTGGALAMMYCPDAAFFEVQFDQIADAVVAGKYDAGVMIHEELLHYPEKGLRCVSDLGKTWCDDTGLPLPVGLNIIRKKLGKDLARDAAATCQRSLKWAQDHFDEAFAFASQFGRGCSQKHVELFSNDDTMCLPQDARRAMRIMFDRVAALGIAPPIDSFEVIDA